MTSIAHSAAAAAEPGFGRGCSRCRGRLYVLVHVDRNGGPAPVTYYACEACAQVVVREL